MKKTGGRKSRWIVPSFNKTQMYTDMATVYRLLLPLVGRTVLLHLLLIFLILFASSTPWHLFWRTIPPSIDCGIAAIETLLGNKGQSVKSKLIQDEKENLKFTLFSQTITSKMFKNCKQTRHLFRFHNGIGTDISRQGGERGVF